MDRILKIKRQNRFYDSLIKYDIYLNNNNKIKISNNEVLELKLEKGENILFVKFWHLKSNTLLLEGNKNRLVDIKNYVTNNQFYVYLFLIVVGIYFSFFNVSEYFFINFIIKFVGFYIFSIPIVSLTFNSKRNILIVFFYKI